MSKRDWLRDERGATAAEFALLVGPMFLLLFGLIHGCLLLYSINKLNFATEAAARCAATSANSGYSGAACSDSTKTQTYFADMYKGATATPVLTQGTGPQYCMTANGVDYVITAPFLRLTVPLASTACFTQ